jgi:hypothetical protein
MFGWSSSRLELTPSTGGGQLSPSEATSDAPLAGLFPGHASASLWRIVPEGVARRRGASRNRRSQLDRALRTFLVAPAAIITTFVVGAGSVAGIALFALVAIMLATSAIGFCPLYKLLHIASRGRTPLPH